MPTKREAEGRGAHPRALTAANEEFSATHGTHAANPENKTHLHGWDPYEVWRTRIKALQDAFRNGGRLR